MAQPNLALLFGGVVAGAVVIDYGVKAMRTAFDSAAQASTGSGSSSSSGSGAGAGTSASAGSVGKVDAGHLPNVGHGVAFTGAAATAWADAILLAIKAPLTTANVQTMTQWFSQEGGGGSNNPLNTTLGGGTGVVDSFGSANVKDYADPASGLLHTAETLVGSFPAVTAALRTGNGLIGNSDATIAAELHSWSGGGYSAIGPGNA